MNDIMKRWIDDVTETQARIRGDVAHLRELGQHAKTGVRIAANMAKARIEHALESVADGILDLEGRVRRARGQR